MNAMKKEREENIKAIEKYHNSLVCINRSYPI